MPIPTIDTSWDMSIELGYGGDILEWEELRRKYTLERLIGGDTPAIYVSADFLELA
jgi:hypothetical protein